MRPTTFDRPLAADAALGAALAVAGVVGSVVAADVSRPAAPIGAFGYALVAVAALALSARRRWPRAALAAATLCTSVYLILGYAYGPILVIFMVAVYSATRYAPTRPAAWCAAAALALLLVHLLTSDRRLGGLGVVPVAAWVVVPAAIGYSLRLRQQAAATVRAEVIRQRVDDERLRIAQEVHDIIGHGLTAIHMQADIALHVMAGKPGQARAALEAISRTSHQALDELRATLAVVRRPDDDLAPTPGLDRLDGLRQRMADAGLRVHLHTAGERAAALPAAVDLAGYRVVQESLTNAIRHSRAGQADVTVRYDPGSVTVTVANPMTDARAAGAGSGIAGMRARVEALGGEFSARPVERRFEVQARLPTGGRA